MATEGGNEGESDGANEDMSDGAIDGDSPHSDGDREPAQVDHHFLFGVLPLRCLGCCCFA